MVRRGASVQDPFLNKPLLKQPPFLFVSAVLGYGGFGRVYRALENSSGKFVPVAVKVALNSMVGHKPGAVAAQLHEAESLYCMPHHPNVVPLLGVYTHERHGLMMVLPEAVGTLGTWMTVPHSLCDRIGVALQIARGLAHIHAFDLVHQDLKPANVLMFPNNLARIADFGLVGGHFRSPEHPPELRSAVSDPAPPPTLITQDSDGSSVPELFEDSPLRLEVADLPEVTTCLCVCTHVCDNACCIRWTFWPLTDA